MKAVWDGVKKKQKFDKSGLNGTCIYIYKSSLTTWYFIVFWVLVHTFFSLKEFCKYGKSKKTTDKGCFLGQDFEWRK